jgi:hypothetical protein
LGSRVHEAILEERSFSDENHKIEAKSVHIFSITSISDPKSWPRQDGKLSEPLYRSLLKLAKFVFLNSQRVLWDDLGPEFYGENP